MGKEFEGHSNEFLPRELNQQLSTLLDQLPKNPNLLPPQNIVQDSNTETHFLTTPPQEIFNSTTRTLFKEPEAPSRQDLSRWKEMSKTKMRRMNSEHREIVTKKLNTLLDTHTDLTPSGRAFAGVCFEDDYINGVNLDIPTQAGWIHDTFNPVFTKANTPQIERTGFYALQTKFERESREFAERKMITRITERQENNEPISVNLTPELSQERLNKLHTLLQEWPKSFAEKYGETIVPPVKPHK